MRVHFSILIVLLAALAAGCGAERAEFSHRKDLDELIPEVQDHIRWVLSGEGDPEWAGYFGTPTEPIAWERLPVNYHVAQGVLAEAESPAEAEEPPAEGPVSELPLNLTSQNRPIEPGQRLAWLSGGYLNSPPVTVAAYDEAAGLLTIEEAYDPAPSTGDRFVIGPGLILEQGRMLYAEHCQHCHGVSGDGNGPTARYLNPLPRDYRIGKFKFTSTNTSDRAARGDLADTIREGIPGTYMPSFKLLSENEMQSLVEYVLWLSMRGEIEYNLVRAFRADYSTESAEARIADAEEDGQSRSEAEQAVIDELEEYLAGDWQDEFNDDTKFLAEQWVNAQAASAQVLPKEAMPVYDYNSPEAQASRQSGRELYLGQKAKCATCHGDQGLGDGGQTLSVQKNPITNEEYPFPGLYDDWGNPLEPRDLTRGIYRGGRRPIDLYRRVYAGIKGTPMPAFGNVLSDQEIWDIVNYVTSIPFEARERSPGDGAGESRPEPAQVAAQTASTETASGSAEAN